MENNRFTPTMPIPEKLYALLEVWGLAVQHPAITLERVDVLTPSGELRHAWVVPCLDWLGLLRLWWEYDALLAREHQAMTENDDSAAKLWQIMQKPLADKMRAIWED